MRSLTFAILPFLFFAGACGFNPLNPDPATPTSPGIQESPPATPNATSAATLTPWPTLGVTPIGLQHSDRQAEAMLASFEDRLRDMPSATRYTIDLSMEFEPEDNKATLAGWVRIQYTNRTSQPMEDLVVMLWPNHESYRAHMMAGPVRVDGVQVDPIVELENLSLRTPLPSPLQPGNTIDVVMPFEVVAEGPLRTGSQDRFGITEGSLIAPTFYPLVPRWIEGDWDQSTGPAHGDTVDSEVAFYEVHVRATEALTLVGSGVEIERLADNGIQIVTMVTGPVRDIALALGPYEQSTRAVDGVQIHSWVLPENSGVQRRLMNTSQVQLAALNDLLGPYPYKELDMVDAPGGYVGSGYPGLVFLGSLSGSSFLTPAVHEIAHQWFYGLVGSDPILEPWLDEAFASYGEILYYENSINPGRASWAVGNMRDQLRKLPEAQQPVGQTLESFNSREQYEKIVFLKGALFLETLRNQMGDRAFFEALQTYVDRHAFEVAAGADFQLVAEETCECDLSELFNRWIYEGGEMNVP